MQNIGVRAVVSALISSVGVRQICLTWEIRGGAKLCKPERQKGRVECLQSKMDGEKAFIISVHIKSISVFCSQFTTN